MNTQTTQHPFKTEIVEFGKLLPVKRERFVELPEKWLDIKQGSIILDVNYPEQTFVFKSWYDDACGIRCALVQDHDGFSRHLFGDSIRLASISGGKTIRNKRGITQLSSAESKLSRAEKRKLRRERRAAVKNNSDI